MATKDSYRYPSSLFQDEQFFLDKTLQKSLRIKLFVFLHGNVWFCGAGFLTTIASYYFTLSSSPSAYDLLFCTAWAMVFVTCYLYEIFWFTSTERKTGLLENVLTAMRNVERNCYGERHYLHNSYRKIKFIRISTCGAYALVALFICFRRIPDSRLPLLLRGLSFTDPWILTVQALQYTISPVGVIAVCHFVEAVVTFVLCTQAYFRALANTLKKSKTEEEIYQVIKLHGELLGSCEELIDMLKMWLFALMTLLFLVSQLVTISIIRGSIDPENLLVLPAQMNSILLMCLYGDVLQQSTECFADLAYSLEWYTKTRRCRTLIQMMIHRAHKPLSLRCPVFGDLSLPVAMAVFNKWYTFMQLLIKLI